MGLMMNTFSAFTPLTKQAVADSLGISIRSVENWINDGTLPAPAKLGNRVYWHPDVYYAWLSHRLKMESSVESLSVPEDAPEPVCRAPASADKTVARLHAQTERKLARLLN